jgi:hypothetical protein
MGAMGGMGGTSDSHGHVTCGAGRKKDGHMLAVDVVGWSEFNAEDVRRKTGQP